MKFPYIEQFIPASVWDVRALYQPLIPITDLATAREIPGSGIGGQVAVAMGRVTVEVTDARTLYRWSARVGFADFPSPELESVLLGHLGFLEHFVATFDGHNHELRFDPIPGFDGTIE